MKKNIIIVLGLAVLGLNTGCSLEPTLADSDDTSITLESKMRNLMNGSYNHMVDYRFFGRNTIIAGEVRSDNMYSKANSNRFPNMSQMSLTPTTGDVDDLFKYGYRGISNANALIHSDYESAVGDISDKHHIIGEAYATRALLHFELLKLFGQQYVAAGSDLGITYTKEYKAENLQIPRGTVAENKADLYSDLEKAIEHFILGENSAYSNNKTYLTLDAAYALKSRIGIYFNDYSVALDASEKIVDNYTITPEDQVVKYWSSEEVGNASIFELFRSTTETDGNNSISNIYNGTAYGDVVAFNSLIADAEFEPDDVRASAEMINTVGGFLRNVGKYGSMGEKIGSDNIKMFRIEEVVLNHAEALHETDPGQALTYLNMITDARGATAYTAATLDNILKERRKELMFEGHRFHDLARTGNDIEQPDEDVAWAHGLIPAGDYRFAMPIPRAEIDANRETTQNPGY